MDSAAECNFMSSMILSTVVSKLCNSAMEHKGSASRDMSIG